MTLKHTTPPQLLGHHAVVIGASMARLLAARVPSEYFERVTLIERDRLEGMGPRKGVPLCWLHRISVLRSERNRSFGKPFYYLSDE